MTILRVDALAAQPAHRIFVEGNAYCMERVADQVIRHQNWQFPRKKKKIVHAWDTGAIAEWSDLPIIS